MSRSFATWGLGALGILAFGALPLGARQIPGVGQWSPTYDWHEQINRGQHPSGPMEAKPCDHWDPSDPNYVQNGAGEFVHAALVPVGQLQGCVVLWRKEKAANSSYPCAGCAPCEPVDHLNTWFFDPGMPTVLFELVQGLQSDIFCAGQSWDRNGELIVAGGIPVDSEVGTYPPETYRLGASRLTVVWPIGGGYPQVQNGVIGAGPPWATLANMEVPRYYPTVLPLIDDDLRYSTAYVPPAGESPTIAGGGTQVLGGPWDGASGGNEFWEVLEPQSDAWRRAFLPVDPAAADTAYGNRQNSPNYGTSGGGFQPSSPDHYLRPEHPAQPTDPLLDSYPRAYAVSTREVFLAGDVGEATNAPGLTWLITPRYEMGSNRYERWALRAIDTPAPPSGRNLWHDSFYDTSVILYEYDQMLDEPKPERILLLGGSRDEDLAPLTHDWQVNDTVWEFVLAPAPSLDPFNDGAWLPKPAPTIVGACAGDPEFTAFERLYGNAVILPDGRIFLEGGSKNDDNLGHCSTCPPGERAPTEPNLDPILYDPGDNAQQGGTVYCMPRNHPIQTSNTVAGVERESPSNHHTARLYHHVSVLLPDGRVLVAGGQEVKEALGPMPFAEPDPRFTGEIFSPPYLDLASVGLARPVISSAPRNITFSMSFIVQASHDPIAPIDAVVLIRPGATTHHFDNDQRYIELGFMSTHVNETTDTLQVTAPESNIAPPGWYMLFVVQDDGLSLIGHRMPSTAAWVNLQ